MCPTLPLGIKGKREIVEIGHREQQEERRNFGRDGRLILTLNNLLLNDFSFSSHLCLDFHFIM